MSEPLFKANPDADLSVKTFGKAARVIVVDDALLDPDSVLAYAEKADFSVPLQRYYPGLTAQLPDSLIATIMQALLPALRHIYGVPADHPLAANGFLGMVTCPPAELKPLQTIPHFDNLLQCKLAMVLYLCEEKHGGTGFFRQVATGLEWVTLGDLPLYEASLRKELHARESQPIRYFQGSDEHYEQIGGVEARFNRLIVYNSNLLHSGLIAPDQLSSHPRQGRLTANMFIGDAAARP